MSLLSGCSSLYDPSVVLCTDKPEFAAYCEVFNASQNEFLVQIQYEESPCIEATNGKRIPDLLISKGLSDPSTLGVFEPLNNLFRDNTVDPEDFYQDLLLLGTQEDKQHILPLNFNLPVVVFQEEALTKEPPELLISLEFMRSQSAAFNMGENEAPTKAGFSPLWNHEFLYYTAVLFEADFRASEIGSIDWSPEGLKSAADFLRSWIEETNGGYEREKAFQDKYLNIPFYKLLEDRRILFYLTDTKSLMSIPQEKRDRLEFRWLSKDGQIPVLDDIYFMGIPRAAQNKRGAYTFLRWILDAQTQTGLMEVNQFKRLMGVYGIAGGFSSLHEVNERHLAQPNYYPLFLGHIPTTEMLRFPLRLPDRWSDLKNRIIEPWLIEAVINPQPPETLESFLTTRLETFSNLLKTNLVDP
jgi:hypothetical protein